MVDKPTRKSATNNKRKKRRKKKKKDEKSITWVVVMASITVAVIGWCMLATAYATYTEGLDVPVPGRVRVGRGSGIALLVAGIAKMAWDGVTQIPNVFSVVKFALQERLGVVIGIGVVETLLLVGGLGMKKLERDMENERKRY